jgi:hypothetical protein
LVATKRVTLPTLSFASALDPTVDPAWRMYDVGAHPPLGALQVIVTVPPLTLVARPVGAPPGRRRGSIRSTPRSTLLLHALLAASLTLS